MLPLTWGWVRGVRFSQKGGVWRVGWVGVSKSRDGRVGGGEWVAGWVAGGAAGPVLGEPGKAITSHNALRN